MRYGLLEGKTALVTGAAQGIGLEIARRFIEEGASVLVADLNAELVAAAAAELAKDGGRAIATRCNVTVESDVDAAVALCVAQLGALDVMVNNAGITRDATMRKMSLEDFRAVIEVHLQGTWLGTRSAAAVMREQGHGSIINISSISGKIGNPGQTNYSAAKAGIVGLTKAAAKEVAHAGVRVNVIMPGLIKTAMTEAMRQDVFEHKLAEVPLGRAGDVRDVANAAVFLGSELSSYMTGTILEVAGGRAI
jgi:3-oxoacyl-[acyl-carrier protein] reductase